MPLTEESGAGIPGIWTGLVLSSAGEVALVPVIGASVGALVAFPVPGWLPGRAIEERHGRFAAFLE